MDSLAARQHWAALDALFSRTLSPGDLRRARQAFPAHVDAVSDVCFQLLLEDPPPELRGTAAALKEALAETFRTR
jgi:hypothetical protein